jgi:hypothetical protein
LRNLGAGWLGSGGCLVLLSLLYFFNFPSYGRPGLAPHWRGRLGVNLRVLTLRLHGRCGFGRGLDRRGRRDRLRLGDG